MKTTELKKDLHDLVDKIENEELLQSILSLLRYNEKQIPERHCRLLSEQQKQDLFASYEESEDEDSLIAREDFLK